MIMLKKLYDLLVRTSLLIIEVVEEGHRPPEPADTAKAFDTAILTRKAWPDVLHMEAQNRMFFFHRGRV